jgi:hypothetical protein
MSINQEILDKYQERKDKRRKDRAEKDLRTYIIYENLCPDCGSDLLRVEHAFPLLRSIFKRLPFADWSLYCPAHGVVKDGVYYPG